MHLRKVVIIVLLLLPLTVWNCDRDNRTGYARLFRPADAEFYHVPVGLCEDYPEETTNLDIIRKDMEFLKQTDVNLLRISFGWDAIESEKDKYNWLFWDDFVKLAVEDYGITLIPYVCYMPRWNSRGAADSLYFWNYPPVDAEQFGEFMKAIVTRYKKWIKTWELWNEPDIWVYWQGSPEEFANLVKIGARAVKEADPEAKVVLGGMAYSENFLEKLFKDYGVGPLVDVVNMHNYFETWSEQSLENIDDHIGKMSQVILKYGNQQPLWMAEVGYSTFRQGTKVSSSYSAYYDYEHTPDYQAVDLFKRLSLIVGTGKVAAVAWYEIKDLPATDEVIGDEYNNRHLGLAYQDYSPKPAQKALLFFNRLFSQPYKNITSQIQIERPDNSDGQIIVFQLKDSSVIVVGWLQTCVPEKRPPAPDEIVADHRSEAVKVVLPYPLTGKAIQYDPAGAARNFTYIRHEQENTIIEPLELKGSQIAILKIEKQQ